MSAFAAVFPLVPFHKTPAIKAWQLTPPGAYKPEGDHGISLQPGEIIIDADPRNYPAGRDVLGELVSAYPELMQTRIVKTPRGGYHYYFTKPRDIKIKKAQPAWPGIDFLSPDLDGSGKVYAIGTGTRTVATPDGKQVDGVYTLVSDKPVASLPQTLLLALQERAARLETGSMDLSLLSEPEFIAICQAAPGAIEGAHGDDTTYQLACQGRDLGLPVPAVFAVMRDHWNHKCLPPWSDSKLLEKVEHAYKYAKNAAGAKTPEAKFQPPEPPTASTVPPKPVSANIVSIDKFQHEKVVTTVHQKQLLLDEKTFLPKNTQANVVYYLRNDQAWKGRIVYNQFADRVEIKGRPDWRREANFGDEGITAYDLAFMQSWFSAQEGIRLEIPTNRLEAALFAAAIPYHPVIDYLDGLEWDGKPRLDTILPATTGCEDNIYTRSAGAKIMIAAVKRIYEPGCKQDYVLVLESNQGEKKSQWVEILGGKWYSTGELVPGDKDSYQVLRGKWIVELPEIDATFSKADFAWLKKIITTGSDTYRPSYARTAQTVPRESIFIATLNPNAACEYLRDFENRRYWPIKTGRLNLSRLKENRDQYFAEAVHRYRDNEKSYMDDPEAIELAKAEQQARRETDPWVEILGSWTRSQKTFNSVEAYAALQLTPVQVHSRVRTRIYAVLRDLGWEYDKNFAGGMWRKLLRMEDLI